MRKKKRIEDYFVSKKKSKNNSLIKVISGGQTGADRAALEAAHEVGYETGGTTCNDYITSIGKDYELKTKYNLKELNLSKLSTSMMYIKRSKMNVDNSDGTIAFRIKRSPGTDKTIGYCITGKWEVINYKNLNSSLYKPLLVINNVSLEKTKENVEKMYHFIIDYEIKILNVCGHREYICDNGSFFHIVKKLLICFLKKCKEIKTN